MCGIAGIFDLSGAPVSAIQIRRMTDVIAHRGPDGEGLWVEDGIGLGHRRLAIIDLSDAAKQPMETPDARYVITYNGELYNYRELRVPLQSKGHAFHSASDTEVVLAAFAEWGLEALPRFNGMFALALYDRKDRRFLLARDRFGVKPVYWMRQGDRLLFGSEAKAILAVSREGPDLDLEALVEYLTFQNFFTDRTLFKGLSLLPAGSYLVAERGRDPKIASYWDFGFAEGGRSDPEALEEECNHLFQQAVNRQLVADVPVNAYLSGGLDSGAITATAAAQMDDMRSFTVGFDMNSASGLELGFDERPRAEFMSYLFGTEHYEMVLKAGDMERAMSSIVYHLEEPRVGQSYPNYYAAKLASRFGKVVLAGTGGDELFGGYPWRYYRAVVNEDFEHYVDQYYGFWQRLIPNGLLHDVLAPVTSEIRHVRTRDIFRDTFKSHAETLSRPEDYVNHSLYLEAKTFLHGLLVVEDKLSMAHSLENRVPFLDNDLVDFAQSLPVRFKLGNLDEVARLDENTPGSKRRQFFEKTSDGKLLLRKVMQRYVPDQVSSAVKQGFSAPDASWFRGESIDYVRQVLFSNHARIYDVLDRATIQKLVQEHLEGTQNRRLLIWSLIYLESFLDCFFGKARWSHGG